MKHSTPSISTTINKALLYTRAIDAEQATSVINRQMETCERAASEQGIQIVGWYCDEQPGSEYRKDLGRLLERLFNDDDEFVVIVDRLETLAQDKPGQRELKSLIRAAGARLVVAQ